MSVKVIVVKNGLGKVNWQTWNSSLPKSIEKG